MIKYFTWILLAMTSVAHAMDDPKDDDDGKIVFTQTPAQALKHRALVEAIENQPDPGPIHYDEGRCLYYTEDPEDVAETSKSPKEVSPDKPNSGPMHYDEDRDLYYFHPKDSDTKEDFPKAFESSDTEKVESSKVTTATASTASDVKPAVAPAPAANAQKASDDDDETTETPQDTIQWLYDHRLNKSYYLSDDFIDTEDAVEPSKSSNTSAATASTTADVKPTTEPAPAANAQKASDDHNKNTAKKHNLIQWFKDKSRNRYYDLSDGFIDTEDAAEATETSKASAATESKTADVKPTAEPAAESALAPAASTQMASDVKTPYYPELQCDHENGYNYFSLLPERSPRRPQFAKEPKTSGVKPASSVNAKTESDDDDDKE